MLKTIIGMIIKWSGKEKGEKNSGESDFGSNTKSGYKKKMCSLIQNRLRVGRKWCRERNTGSGGEWKDPAEEEGWIRMADPDGDIEIKRGVSRAEPGVLPSMHACFGLSCVEIFFCFALLLSLSLRLKFQMRWSALTLRKTLERRWYLRMPSGVLK